MQGNIKSDVGFEAAGQQELSTLLAMERNAGKSRKNQKQTALQVHSLRKYDPDTALIYK
ncbi:hypothetical protein PL84_03525 [Vibrio anguillarum]|uniref:hypothetical protein n=1 Tax=Vibrio anguillarum TaxID=55601 RepID=UPI001AD80D98|nr:hypothetical protein [Vibrio anguillarum]MBT2909651.1 hypothetical protein [Vibrio anguillarum]MBT2942498.1 hypothetical protein [Vibrio anguillarum]MBT2950678.1 hypothetical protein [Vibrio anguillarum]MBT2979423.1 hypothetical protein [Vibrio anguillarum]